VRCEAVEYTDFPTVEWTLYFKNSGDSDSPFIEAIKALDIHLEREKAGPFTLRRIRGDVCGPTSFEPLTEEIQPGETRLISPVGGRPTNTSAPYFNLQWEEQGLIAAIGWPGQWSASFERVGQRGLHFTAGQESCISSFIRVRKCGRL